MKNRNFLWLPVLLLAVPLAYIAKSLEFNYSISSKGILYPAREWTLSRTADGNLINSIRDNRNNSVAQYSVTEFQRGDMASFSIRPEIYARDTVFKGDTIGNILSQNEQGRYIELQGELSLQKKLLSVYSSGEKPGEINIARERINLARQEHETQLRITERNKILFEKAYIPEEEYELSQNELAIKKQNYLIAESEYEALVSGAKQEQLDYVLANIESLEQQLKHIEKLISDFTITSPVTGKIIKQQGREVSSDYESILKVADTENYIMIVPVDIYNLPFLDIGQEILFTHPTGKEYTAYISDIDNSSQLINGKQKIFLTALVEAGADEKSFHPNMVVEISIPSGNIPIQQYFSRLVNEVYNN